MPDYQAQIFDANGLINEVVEMTCADDRSALKQASFFVGLRHVRVWSRTRQIGLLHALD